MEYFRKVHINKNVFRFFDGIFRGSSDNIKFFAYVDVTNKNNIIFHYEWRFSLGNTELGFFIKKYAGSHGLQRNLLGK